MPGLRELNEAKEVSPEEGNWNKKGVGSSRQWQRDVGDEFRTQIPGNGNKTAVPVPSRLGSFILNLVRFWRVDRLPHGQSRGSSDAVPFSWEGTTLNWLTGEVNYTARV